MEGKCVKCGAGSYRAAGLQPACVDCPVGLTTAKAGAVEGSECTVPICVAGMYLNATTNSCTACPRGYYQDEEQQTECKECPPDTSTKDEAATSSAECTNRYILPLPNLTTLLVLDGSLEHVAHVLSEIVI